MKNKKLFAVLLAAMLAGTSVLAGCNNNNQGSGGASSQGGSSSTPSNPSSSDSGSGYTSKSGIPISAPGEFPIVEETYNLDVFIKQLSYKLTDVTTNTFTQEMEAKTNVHLDMTVSTDDSYT